MPAVAWGFRPWELAQFGADGARRPLSEDEAWLRKEKAEEVAAKGSSSEEDDSDDDGGDDEQEGQNKENGQQDEALTVFGVEFLRCLRPRRPVLGDPLLVRWLGAEVVHIHSWVRSPSTFDDGSAPLLVCVAPQYKGTHACMRLLLAPLRPSIHRVAVSTPRSPTMPVVWTSGAWRASSTAASPAPATSGQTLL